MMTDLTLQSAVSLAEKISKKEISAVELLQLHFDKVDRFNKEINAVIWQDRDAALKEAESL